MTPQLIYQWPRVASLTQASTLHAYPSWTLQKKALNALCLFSIMRLIMGDKLYRDNDRWSPLHKSFRKSITDGKTIRGRQATERLLLHSTLYKPRYIETTAPQNTQLRSRAIVAVREQISTIHYNHIRTPRWQNVSCMHDPLNWLLIQSSKIDEAF